ncbi:MAG: 4-hydroxy-tetrahydrodipicolinate reductase [Pseudomonadota bacterium]
MAAKTKIAIIGASGRMGQMLTDIVTAHGQAELTGATEREGHAWVGLDLGTAMGSAPLGVPVVADLEDIAEQSDVIIDFSTPATSVANSRIAAKFGLIHVVGTTGLSADETVAIDEAGRETVVIRAGNMSLGVNLLVQLTQKVAAALDEDFDIEIVEAHHHHKVDAPSGTALMLGEAAATGRGVALQDVADRGRDGITGARQRGDIGFTAIRGGDVVGEHDVIFAAQGERIVLRHLATDRAIFARGALKAALWGQKQPAGCYDMLDVLGL